MSKYKRHYIREGYAEDYTEESRRIRLILSSKFIDTIAEQAKAEDEHFSVCLERLAEEGMESKQRRLDDLVASNEYHLDIRIASAMLSTKAEQLGKELIERYTRSQCEESASCISFGASEKTEEQTAIIQELIDTNLIYEVKQGLYRLCIAGADHE